MGPTATPTESGRIAIVKEWVKKNFNSVFSEALLSQESIRVSLPSLDHVLLDDRVTLARPWVTSAQKRPLNSPSMGKGKKSRLEGVGVNSRPLFGVSIS